MFYLCNIETVLATTLIARGQLPEFIKIERLLLSLDSWRLPFVETNDWLGAVLKLDFLRLIKKINFLATMANY